MPPVKKVEYLEVKTTFWTDQNTFFPERMRVRIGDPVIAKFPQFFHDPGFEDVDR